MPEEALLLTQAIDSVMRQLGKKAAKAVLEKVFPKKDETFKKAATRAIVKIDKQYNGELFGGNMVESLTKAEGLELLEKFLIPFEQPTEEDFGKVVHLENLPPDFFMVLRSALLTELFETPATRKTLIEVFHVIQQDNLQGAVSDLGSRQKEGFGEVLQILKKIESASQTIKPSRKNYADPGEYIPRGLYPIADENKSYIQATHALTALAATEKKILVLSMAGMGKSFELKKLAHHFDSVDQTLFPVFIELNTYTNQDIDVLLEWECKGWQEIPADELLIIFDGLDEVHTDFFEIFISKLLAFSTARSQSHIVVSCRDNFLNPTFSPTAANGFSIFRLKELSYWDVRAHVKRILGKERGEKFLSQIQSLNLTEIVTSPFFLIFLLQAFERESKLPVSKIDLFEKLIDYRIEKDKERFARSGMKLDKRMMFIRDQITRLALVMETAGRNYLSSDEFETLIPGYDNHRELIEHTFLFDRAKTSTWQFEHNNFQEYLAAKVLANKPLEKVKALIALPPDQRIIKPTWVNTLSFLFIMKANTADFDGLLRWLIDADRELLLRFEKGRVDLSIREDIFLNILDDYQSKGIVTRSEKFDVTDLAKFVSESRKIIELLLGRLRGSRSRLLIGEITRMLPHFEFIGEYRNEFQPALEEIIMSDETPTDACYYALAALSKLEWRGKKSFEFILPRLSFESQYERAGIFSYLAESGFQDDYVDLIVELASFDKGLQVYKNHPAPRSHARLHDESVTRERCFLSIASPAGIRRILIFFAEIQQNHTLDSFVRDVLSHGLLDKIGGLLRAGNKYLLDSVVYLFLKVTKYHQKEKGAIFIEFFDASQTRTEAARIIVSSSADDFFALGMIADEGVIEYVVDQYEQGKLSDQQIFSIRNTLQYLADKKLHDLFYKKVNALSGNKFLYLDTPTVNWKEVRQRKLKKDLDLLMDRNEFVSRIRQIFELEGKDSIAKEDLWDHTKKHVSQENYFDNNIAIDVLRHERSTPLEKTAAIEYYMDDVKWEWFQINKLIQYDSLDTNTLTQREIDFVKAWCDKSLVAANFSTAIDADYYRWLEIFLAYWIRRFDFKYPDRVYLDLLWVDSNCLIRKTGDDQRENMKSTSLGDWVVSKVGLSKVSEQILQNFKAGIKNSSVLTHHISLCARHGITSVLPLIEVALNTAHMETYDLLGGYEDFLTMGGKLSIVEDALANNSSFDHHDRARLIEMLIKHSSKWIKSFLKDGLQTTDDETRKSYAKFLMEMGQIEGLEYYRNWVEKHHRFDDFVGSKHFLAVSASLALPVLIDMVEIYLKPNFDRDHLHAQDQDLLETICKIASQNEGQYRLVKEKFEKFIKDYDGKILYYYSRHLDQSYYSSLTSSLTITEIASQVDILLKAGIVKQQSSFGHGKLSTQKPF